MAPLGMTRPCTSDTRTLSISTSRNMTLANIEFQVLGLEPHFFRILEAQRHDAGAGIDKHLNGAVVDVGGGDEVSVVHGLELGHGHELYRGCQRRVLRLRERHNAGQSRACGQQDCKQKAWDDAIAMERKSCGGEHRSLRISCIRG
jgi:hypothetical protein